MVRRIKASFRAIGPASLPAGIMLAFARRRVDAKVRIAEDPLIVDWVTKDVVLQQQLPTPSPDYSYCCTFSSGCFRRIKVRGS